VRLPRGKHLDDLIDRKQLPSPRELQVMLLIAEGLTSKEIAQRLGTVEKTIGAQRTSVMRKLKLNKETQIVRWLYENGLLEPP